MYITSHVITILYLANNLNVTSDMSNWYGKQEYYELGILISFLLGEDASTIER